MPPPSLPPVHLPIDPDAPPLSADELERDPGGDFRDEEVAGEHGSSGIDRERPQGEDPGNDVTLLPPD